jgi:hypothetical protein
MQLIEVGIGSVEEGDIIFSPTTQKLVKVNEIDQFEGRGARIVQFLVSDESGDNEEKIKKPIEKGSKILKFFNIKELYRKYKGE